MMVLAEAAGPELRVTPGGQKATTGKAYYITCEITWTGGADEYVILPAVVDPVDWGKATVRSASATRRDGKNVVSQTIELVPEKSGEFQTPVIEIAYQRPEDVKQPEEPESPMHPTGPDAIPRLRADQFPLLVQPHTTPAWPSGVLGALFVFAAAMGVAGWAYRRRRSSEYGATA